MPTIKFSHNYFKMPINIESRKTYLIGVSRVHYKDLPEGFKDYDTMYAMGLEEVGHYSLPKTELIILTLFTNGEQSPRVWTTVRRYTNSKYVYYKNLIGKEVVIKVN